MKSANLAQKTIGDLVNWHRGQAVKQEAKAKAREEELASKDRVESKQTFDREFGKFQKELERLKGMDGSMRDMNDAPGDVLTRGTGGSTESLKRTSYGFAMETATSVTGGLYALGAASLIGTETTSYNLDATKGTLEIKRRRGGLQGPPDRFGLPGPASRFSPSVESFSLDLNTGTLVGKDLPKTDQEWNLVDGSKIDARPAARN